MKRERDQAEEFDQGYDEEEDEGEQEYPDIPPERELITTPYDPTAKALADDIRNKDLIVNPEFQRNKVWDRTRQSRLIESLLLNIPIPVCFFAEDADGKRVVVDGQQRLRAIEEFLSGTFKLHGLQVLGALNGKRWADLTERQARLIKNRTIRCIVISEKSHPDIRFEVFERLNTGVVALTDQELRNCIYRGNFNAFLHKAAKNEKWLALLRKRQPDNRMRHEELILRFLAVKASVGSYKPPLKKFLNDFMKAHRNPKRDDLAQFTRDFQRAVRRVTVAFGTQAFRRAKLDKNGDTTWDAAINRAVFDIQMIGLFGIPTDDLKRVSEELVKRFATLCQSNQEFSDAITKSTADRLKFYHRLRVFKKLLDKLNLSAPLLQNLPTD